ncbi:MAG TPA: 4Fe-4S dicluster domain-containing protein [Caldisericia bacterium]|nr:4Fe-4S dicluster domain-containing protein [Caldisericia bacterium]HPF48871.1 4Fe-4S dicluster domain-containing protein [Caldisericia bacterium]HPI83265.1 4Fe-4S dicluster domain-containing protein [Caldisericia bacterium]HPQ92492.1 4Fe-4S dicluster domain-containing protein [Caldisericia bacterium]HRV74410.1 4Fe-4S dicluster domain-containing protein [Caldisericia bacterium]
MQLSKEKMKELLQKLIETKRVFAPVNENGNTNFLPISNPDSIDLDTVRTKAPAKEVVFPQADKIVTLYSKDGAIQKIEDVARIEETVLFGARPCDARGIEILDNFFLAQSRKDGGEQKYSDPYWKERREKTTIISTACTRPLATCGCSSLGIHPASEKGADILLIPNGDKFDVMVVTNKGKELTSKYSEFFTDGGNPTETQQKVKNACEALMTFAVDTSNAGKFENLRSDNPVWKKASFGCISCGVCTFFCPTCHCFETRDRKVACDKFEKTKCWDSCSFNNYSLEASGHNPRPVIVDRFSNRVLDKFQYHVTLYGEIACTGCGRCSDLCPAGITLSDTLAKLGGAL